MRARKAAGGELSAVAQVSRAAGIVAIVFLLTMMVFTVVDVLLRYFFNAPISGSIELVEFCMVVAGFLGLAWCAVKRGHVRVEFVINRLPPRAQVAVDTVTLLMALTVVPLVAWQAFLQAWYAFVDKAHSDYLEIPDFPFYIVFGLGFTLLALVMLTLLAELIGKVVRK